MLWPKYVAVSQLNTPLAFFSNLLFSVWLTLIWHLKAFWFVATAQGTWINKANLKSLLSAAGSYYRRSSAGRDIDCNSREDFLSEGFKERHPAKHQDHYRKKQHCGCHLCAKNGTVPSIDCSISLLSTLSMKLLLLCFNKMFNWTKVILISCFKSRYTSTGCFLNCNLTTRRFCMIQSYKFYFQILLSVWAVTQVHFSSAAL